MRERTVIASRYELRAGLGRGGMAEVWEGYDLALDRQVAVKFIHRGGLPAGADYHKVEERFARECRVTAKLEHPGVPTVHDVGTHEGESFLVMQLVKGHNLRDVVAERGPLPVAWVAAIGAQVCSVLAAAHAAALVHRDLKPTNLMLCPDGTVTVLDFGIAAVLDGVDVVKLTTTGHPIGSVAYMAPEQLRGGEVSPATDLYGLGCVLHELLTESPPFGGETPYAVVQHHLSSPPPALRPVRPDVPASLAELVQRLLAKDAGARPADAAEVYHQLVPYVAEAATGHRTAPAGELGPVRPYHLPFGPLPVLRTATTTSTLRLTRPPVAAGRSGAALDTLYEQKEEAGRLVDQGRLTRAGRVLAEATAAAAAAWGTDDPEVVDARLSLANLYLLGADHRRALVEFQRLLPDLQRHFGPDHEFVREARRSVVECHEGLGEFARARSELHALAGELEWARGPQDPEVGELRSELRRLAEGSW